jgi:ubiquinol-cytochrome c reductase cytochrome c1 subunit
MLYVRTTLSAAWLACGAALPAIAESTAVPSPPAQSWSFSGAFGSVDMRAARRGFQIYSESCASCHSMDFLHYRDLSGIGFTADQIKAIAAKVNVPAGFDAQGKPLTKPATPASTFLAPFADEDAARAAMNGALPPDLSLAVNAFPDGANYIYALLTGYGDPPGGMKIADGMNYNRYFAGHQIAMPPPLSDGQFIFADATRSTVAQNAHDVVTFLAWAANPEMSQRKRLGFPVVGYFLAMAGVTYVMQRRLWDKLK